MTIPDGCPVTKPLRMEDVRSVLLWNDADGNVWELCPKCGWEMAPDAPPVTCRPDHCEEEEAARRQGRPLKVRPGFNVAESAPAVVTANAEEQVEMCRALGEAISGLEHEGLGWLGLVKRRWAILSASLEAKR